jgi:hypothetical protein
MGAYLNGVVQVGFASTDLTGALGRTLTKGLGRYKTIDPYFHGKAFSDASWIMFRSMYTGGAWTDVMLAKLPPFPAADSVDRTTFQAIPVVIPTVAGATNAIVRFGYAEHGAYDAFYCTSRQEKCLAVAATVPSDPFKFPSDGSGGVESGVAGLSCGGGCTVAVPAISQRMLYYQVVLRDASNATVSTGAVKVVAVP